MRKPFSKSLHDQCDAFGRDIVKKFVAANWNMTAIDNPDDYAVDLILMKDGQPCGYAEVEVRLAWKTVEFPYADLNVPFRKKKLLSGNDLPTYFFSINKDGTALFYCGSEAVLQSEVQEVRNRFVGKGEHFYKVSLDSLTHVTIAQ